MKPAGSERNMAANIDALRQNASRARRKRGDIPGDDDGGRGDRNHIAIIARIEPGGEESSCFSGEVDPPLDRHELGNRSMLSPRCKLREPEFSLLVHLTKGILGIHLREQSARL